MEERQTTHHTSGPPYFVVLHGHSLGKVFPLEGESWTLGSSPFRATFSIRDGAVKPRHVKISADAKTADHTIVSLAPGVTINGEALEAERRLNDGDRVQIGETVLEYYASDPLRAGFHRAIDRLINRDHLSGLLSKRRFDRDFDHALEAAKDEALLLSTLMGDVDNLKQINDGYGHLMGEFVVGQIGRIIGDRLPPGSVATRFGGDEYQVLLPHSGKSDAISVAERIRESIEGYTFQLDDATVIPSISIGVATFPEDGERRTDLTRAADLALYRAKHRGGNTVSV